MPSEIALFFHKTAVIYLGDVSLANLSSLPVEPMGRRGEVSVELRPQIIWAPRFELALSWLFSRAILLDFVKRRVRTADTGICRVR